MEPKEQFAENLRARRLRVGWSQEELANQADLHFTAIAKLERADRSPRLETLVKLSRAFGIRPSELLRGIE